MNSTPVGLIATVMAALGAAEVSLDLAAWVAVIGALGTGAYNFFKVRQNRPLVGTEIEDRAVARMRLVLDEYAKDNERLRGEVAKLEEREVSLLNEVASCRNRIARLEEVLRRNGLIGEL